MAGLYEFSCECCGRDFEKFFEDDGTGMIAVCKVCGTICHGSKLPTIGNEGSE